MGPGRIGASVLNPVLGFGACVAPADVALDCCVLFAVGAVVGAVDGEACRAANSASPHTPTAADPADRQFSQPTLNHACAGKHLSRDRDRLAADVVTCGAERELEVWGSGPASTVRAPRTTVEADPARYRCDCVGQILCVLTQPASRVETEEATP